MARTVFILGAGTSAQAGAPLMKDFLREIRDIQSELPQDDPLSQDFGLVMEGYRLLQPVYANMRMNYEANIEELFATFEMAKILGTEALPGLDPESLSAAMKKTITATIERRMKFDLASNQKAGIFIYPAREYRDFIHLIRDITFSRRSDSSTAILSFNYDLGLEQALEFGKVPFDYCLTPSTRNGIPYLKLHGSLNWGVCPNCNSIVPLSTKDFFSTFPIESEARPYYLSMSKYIKASSHCEPLEKEPFIVPPTWNKTQYHQQISSIWKIAAQELSEATNIFVIGYSLPSTDQFFKHLLALSLSKGSVVDNFGIVDPLSEVEKRYREILGQPIQDVITFFPNRFDGCGEPIRRTLGMPTSKWKIEDNWG